MNRPGTLILAVLLVTALVAVAPAREALVDLFSPAESETLQSTEAPPGGSLSLPPPEGDGDVEAVGGQGDLYAGLNKKQREIVRQAAARSNAYWGLTKARVAEIREIVAGDGSLAAVLTGVNSEIVNVSPWNNRPNPELVGGIVEIRLSPPLTKSRVELPQIAADEDGDGYTQYTFRGGINKTTELFVLVDLKKDAVVAIRPSGPEGSLTPSPDSGMPPGSSANSPEH